MAVRAVKYEREYVVREKWEARRLWERVKGEISNTFLWGGIFSILVPPFAIGFLGVALSKFLRMWNDMLSGEKKQYYERAFAPKMAKSHYVVVGYEVPSYYLNKHISYLNELDAGSERAKKYLLREESITKTVEVYRQVGLSKKQLTTHFWLIGTTGAGKTSLIMTLIKEQAKNGGGVIFVDGKADDEMFLKLYNIMKEQGREHDVYLVNFLTTDDKGTTPIGVKEHTNTFNPIAGMNAEQVINFFMSLQGEPTGDQAYWVGRGRALLSPIVRFLDLRSLFWKEPYTVSTISDYISDIQRFTFMAGFTKALLKAKEKSLSVKAELRSVVEKAKKVKGALNPEFPHVDAVVSYFAAYTQEKDLLKTLGEDYDFISKLYAVNDEAQKYAGEITNTWKEIIENVAKTFYAHFDTDIFKLEIGEALKFYAELVEKNREAYTLDTTMFATAVQQHSYAQQQWTNIMTTLKTYEHIFGAQVPDIDLVDVIRNQKIVYFLLPPLKQSADTTKILGTLILTAIKTAIATALGGEMEGLSSEQRKVFKKRITPIPLGLIILDEYGAYPIKGLDTILAQVRSINISTIISTQDITSARAEGQDENSLKRIFANTQKIILRNLDRETWEFLAPYFKEKVVTTSYILDPETQYTYQKTEFSVQERNSNVEKLFSAFKNGLGIIITDDEPVVTQFYYSDAPQAKKIKLNKTQAFVWD